MTARIALVILLLLALACVSTAQEHAAPASQQEGTPQATQPAGANEHAAKEPAKGGHGEEGGDPHAEFKYSASVQWLARTTGMEVTSAYWVSVVFNFLVMATILYILLGKRMVAFFRDRTDSIQNAMEEARRASEDANARLAQIEGRLSRLDSEVAELRNASEADAAIEDKRIQEAAREDAARIVRHAEQEIEAAARLARRDLRAYAAELAVSLAEKKIQVTPATDQELVRSFTDRLDRDGGHS
jgi:F-type H+-transporting ATPase subunit b